jgi:predicted nucleic acid-binding protein
VEIKTVFLDANVLWSAAGNPDGMPWRVIWDGKADFVTSHYALAEAARNVPASAARDLKRLAAKIKIVPDAFGPPPIGITLPGKDIPILSSAAACGAQFLVTGDGKHFDRYYGRIIGGVKIILPRDLAKEL